MDCENRGRGGGVTASPAVGKLRTMCLQVTGLLENTASLSTKRVPGNFRGTLCPTLMVGQKPGAQEAIFPVIPGLRFNPV